MVFLQHLHHPTGWCRVNTYSVNFLANYLLRYLDVPDTAIE